MMLPNTVTGVLLISLSPSGMNWPRKPNVPADINQVLKEHDLTEVYPLESLQSWPYVWIEIRDSVKLYDAIRDFLDKLEKIGGVYAAVFIMQAALMRNYQVWRSTNAPREGMELITYARRTLSSCADLIHHKRAL